MVYKRKKYHYGDTHLKKKWRTKRRTKDLDQIDDDLKPENAQQLINQEVDYDKPGAAQFYCVHCARYFIDNQALHEHFRTKVHKRRLKALEDEPYSIEESERAAGFGSWKPGEKRKIETIDPDEVKKAKLNNEVLTPCIDFEEQLKDREGLLKNIEARKLGTNLEKIENRWNFFKMIDDHKSVLELTKTEIHRLINKLREEDPDKNKEEIEKLLLHAKFVKDDLKNVKEYAYGVEENAHLAVLSLPNLLHPKTPTQELSLFSFLTPPEAINKNHMEIAKTQNLIEYTDPTFYFLKSEAALFEFALTNYFQENLLEMDLTQFSNADFASTVVVEGCGTEYLDASKVFTLEGDSDLNRLHIVGGGSLYSFMAYFAKHSIQLGSLPLKFFSVGRKYVPVAQGSDLFNVSQSSVARIFVATEDDDQKVEEVLQSLTQKIIKVYENLGYHFRVVLVPAHDLEKSESLRTSIQMYSNYSQKYIEVGNLSVYDNYLSKRLLFTYSVNKDRKFLKVVSGEVLNVQRFLACAIENNYFYKKPLLSNVLKKHVQL